MIVSWCKDARKAVTNEMHEGREASLKRLQEEHDRMWCIYNANVRAQNWNKGSNKDGGERHVSSRMLRPVETRNNSKLGALYSERIQAI